MSIWLCHLYVGLDAIVPIASIGCTLNLADVYDRVVFPTEAKAVYEIDGKRFTTLEEFYDVVGRVLIPGSRWGHNLNAFNDILRGGFGTPEGGFLLRWKNSHVSRERLGYPETVRQLETRLNECHPTNRDAIASELETARNGIGPTAFGG